MIFRLLEGCRSSKGEATPAAAPPPSTPKPSVDISPSDSASASAGRCIKYITLSPPYASVHATPEQAWEGHLLSIGDITVPKHPADSRSSLKQLPAGKGRSKPECTTQFQRQRVRPSCNT